MQCAQRAGVCAVVLLTPLALGAPCAGAGNADLTVAGAAIHVTFDPDAFTVGAGHLLAWVERSATIVAGYYGRFPCARVTVRVIAESGEGVHGGKTWAHPDGFIRVQLGRGVTDAQLLADWVLVHEMIHLALPDTGEQHVWLSEGIATYVEGVARVHAGNRSETDVWSEAMREMPWGLPRSGDHGLDHTHTWGRTYWGGALFCLLADLQIRERSHNRLGLQDALAAVARASGGLSADWPIERVFRTGDAAVGGRELEQLYAQMKDQPSAPDLDALWRELGVEADGSGVRLSDEAPLAAVRRAIMSGAASERPPADRD